LTPVRRLSTSTSLERPIISGSQNLRSAPVFEPAALPKTYLSAADSFPRSKLGTAELADSLGAALSSDTPHTVSANLALIAVPSSPSAATEITSIQSAAYMQPLSDLPASFIASSRRAAHPAMVPPMQISVDGTQCTMQIPLPRPGGELFARDMITVSVKRNNSIHVVADAWHLERDCEYIVFVSYYVFTPFVRQATMSGRRDSRLVQWTCRLFALR